MKSSVETTKPRTNHTLGWMSFRGKHVQAPKVPQTIFRGHAQGPCWPSLIHMAKRKAVTVQPGKGFSICVCHPCQVDGVKFTVTAKWESTASAETFNWAGKWRQNIPIHRANPYGVQTGNQNLPRMATTFPKNHPFSGSRAIDHWAESLLGSASRRRRRGDTSLVSFHVWPWILFLTDLSYGAIISRAISF